MPSVARIAWIELNVADQIGVVIHIVVGDENLFEIRTSEIIAVNPFY